jgi:outer membrane immunogenic protein
MRSHSRLLGAASLVSCTLLSGAGALANPRAPQYAPQYAPQAAPQYAPQAAPQTSAQFAPQGLYAQPPVYGRTPPGGIPSGLDPRADDPIATQGASIFAGCYAGLHGGASWNQLSSRERSSALAGVPEQKFTVTSVMSGVQGGCNWARDDMLFGVEAEASLPFRSRGQSSYVNFSKEMTRNELKGAERPFFALAMRAGLVADRALFFTKLGASYTKTRVDQIYENGTFTSTDQLFSPYTAYTTRGDMERIGFVFGGGVEYLVASNWSVKAEYNLLYAPGGDVMARQIGQGVSWTYAFPAGGEPTKTETPVTGVTRVKAVSSMRNVLKVGVNHRF